MAELTDESFALFRDCFRGAVQNIRVYNKNQEVTTIDLPDPRVQLSPPNGNLLSYRLTLKGSDPEIKATQTKHVRIDGSALRKPGSNGFFAGPVEFDPFEFQHEDDKITIRHDVRIPGEAPAMIIGKMEFGSGELLLKDEHFGKMLFGPASGSFGSVRLRAVEVKRQPIGAMFTVVGRNPDGPTDVIQADVEFLTAGQGGYSPQSQTIRLLEGSYITCYKLDDENDGARLYGLAVGQIIRVGG